ncbi:MAG: PD-(D/E)XK nuclease-like domain-containing protein, partial [Actinomycetota bacterium]|nr:PD-(D/E)XK nuclease-like domain-containing protein [Actinomycetota bacterium]
LYRWQLDHPVHLDAFDFGSAAHELVLGVGPGISIIPATSRAKADQEAHKAAKEAAYADGKIPVTAEQYEHVKAMADVLASHTLAMRLLSDGKPEVSAYCVDEPTGVMRRGRFDWLGSTILSDYKTAVSAEPGAFARAAATVDYHMQAAWYLDLARDLGHPAEAFGFIVQEKWPPYLVSVVELDDASVQLGRARNRRALERFRDCSESGIWPGYQRDDAPTTVSLPRWVFYQEKEDQ